MRRDGDDRNLRRLRTITPEQTPSPGSSILNVGFEHRVSGFDGTRFSVVLVGIEGRMSWIYGEIVDGLLNLFKQGFVSWRFFQTFNDRISFTRKFYFEAHDFFANRLGVAKRRRRASSKPRSTDAFASGLSSSHDGERGTTASGSRRIRPDVFS